MMRRIAFLFLLIGFIPNAHAVRNMPLQDSMFDMVTLFWGDQKAQDDARNCTQDESRVNGSGNDLNGSVGAVNAFFCKLEKVLGLKGPTPGLTGSFPMYTWTNYIRAEIAGEADGGAYNGYDHEAKIWVCSTGGGVDCSTTAMFWRAAYLTWSFNADGTVNKGVMLHDDGVLHGTDGQGASAEPVLLTWDTGTTAVTRKVTFLQSVDATGGTYMNLYGETVYSGNIVSSSTILSINGGAAQCTGGVANTYNTVCGAASPTRRFINVVDTSTNVSGVSFQDYTTSLAGETQWTTTSDTASLSCYTRVATATDWAYTADGANACNSFSAWTWPTVYSAQAVGARTPADLTPHWNGMTLHPSAI